MPKQFEPGESVPLTLEVTDNDKFSDTFQDRINPSGGNPTVSVWGPASDDGSDIGSQIVTDEETTVVLNPGVYRHFVTPVDHSGLEGFYHVLFTATHSGEPVQEASTFIIQTAHD